MEQTTTQPRYGRERSGRYQAVHPLAVASVVLGALTVVLPLHWILGFIPLAGVALAWLALRQIANLPEEFTGKGVAWTGLALSVGLAMAGYGWMLFRTVQEVPYGYELVTYEMLQPGPGERVPVAAFELQDKKIFIRGYMMPTRQQTRLKQFVLCPAIPGCPWCTPDPKPTEMLYVTLAGDMETQYTEHLRRLGGKFTVDPTAPGGLPYQIDVDYLR
ncbi:MAG: DUF4190 domain-containing protein [Pirellulales bacterium]|nr:DUF4190 domain-containing protein [Pirellulales bacterium]